MQDLMNQNPLSVTGTPSLVTGALTVDTDQALSFNGSTNSASATDSASLSFTGSLSLEFFIKLASYPGSTQAILSKSGSYAVNVTSGGLLQFVLTGPSVTTTLTANSALPTNAWNHVVCVFNNNYAGAQRFGKTNNGTQNVLIADGDGNNSGVTQTTLLEQGILNSVSMSLQYIDSIWPVEMSAVVYADAAGPDVLVTKSEVRTLLAPTPAWRSPTWVTFPVTPVVVPAGTYHIGYVSDTLAGPQTLLALAIGSDPTGGMTSYRNDSVSSPSSPFGPPTATTTNVLSAYCDYTATSRSGNEGKALIYINGALNVSTTRTDSITDTANALQVCPTLAAQIDEVSVWNKALSAVQIATHYTAH